MGLDNRIPLQRAGMNLSDPMQRAIADHESQPPIGCMYVDKAGAYNVLGQLAQNTIAFSGGTAATLYDPYNLIDGTNNRVKIPFPGVWDIDCKVSGTTGGTGGFTYSEVTEGFNTPLNTNNPYIAGVYASSPNMQFFHFINFPILITPTWIANNTWVQVRNYGTLGNQDVRIAFFSLWLRSAYIPGKY